MARGEQIDKLSKKLVVLNNLCKKFAKKQHNRFLRRIRKNINEPNPNHNKYRGFIG